MIHIHIHLNRLRVSTLRSVCIEDEISPMPEANSNERPQKIICHGDGMHPTQQNSCQNLKYGSQSSVRLRYS